jgi:hypothetical protein
MLHQYAAQIRVLKCYPGVVWAARLPYPPHRHRTASGAPPKDYFKDLGWGLRSRHATLIRSTKVDLRYEIDYNRLSHQKSLGNSVSEQPSSICQHQVPNDDAVMRAVMTAPQPDGQLILSGRRLSCCCNVLQPPCRTVHWIL